MATPVWANYYQEVIPSVLRALRDYNAQNTPLITKKAIYLIIQAYGEQSPGTAGLPSANHNRLFNAQAEVDGVKTNENGDIISFHVKDGQQEDGVTIQGLSQGEGETNATRVKKTSPTFYYDSPERSVTHTLKVLKQRYTPAFDVLTNPASSFAQYANTLQAVHYAGKNKTYAADLKTIQNQVIGEVKAWLKNKIAQIPNEITALEEQEQSLNADEVVVQQHTQFLRPMTMFDGVDQLLRDDAEREKRIKKKISRCQFTIDRENDDRQLFQGLLKELP